MRRVDWLATLVAILSSLPTVAQSPVENLTDLDFMSGCWTGNAGPSTVIEEIYTRPSSNLMLGTTRYMRGQVTTMFEFTLIQRDSTGITMLPYPRGRASEDAFRLTFSGHGRAVFEAPQHDFPKRIIYSRESADQLQARIDGGAESDRVTEWTLNRTSCPGP